MTDKAEDVSEKVEALHSDVREVLKPFCYMNS